MGNKKIILISAVAVLLVVAAGGYLLLKPKESSESVVTSTPTGPLVPKPTSRYQQTAGNFLVTGDEICAEDGKPAVYFFGSSTCPHCLWEKPIAQKVFEEFKDQISYHENFDNDEDSSVYMKYVDIHSGYVPFLVLGCKYARMGAGENLGTNEEESKRLEEEALTAVLCKLTGERPAEVCSLVKNKVLEVK